MSKLPVFVLLSLFLINPQTSFAKKEGKGHMKEILSQLNLSDEQKEQLKAARKENKKLGKGQKEEIKKLWQQMKDKFGTAASESEMRSLHNKLMSLKSEKREKRFNRIMKIRNILNVEQRKKFQQLRMAKRKGKKHGFDEE